jgi:glycine betaine/proline transport system ATP-binding protein
VTPVSAEGLTKVFGPQPAQALRRLREGTSPEQLRSEGTTPAVLDASFTVSSGETFVVMGLSGSGKSTLIRMLNGLLAPTAGTIAVGDSEITRMGARELRGTRQRTISMVFQHFALLPHRTVLENVGYGLDVRGDSREEVRRASSEAIELVGLSGWEEQYPQQLSGGMRQRVGLARALAAGTDVLLMDEAFSALDPLIKREMQDQLLQLQTRLRKTIVFITHDLNEAMRLGDRIAVMRAGRIVQIGTSEQILNEPSDDYVSQFVRDVDRSRVLTAGSIARPDGLLGARGEPVSEDTPLHELFGLFSGGAEVVPVLDGDRRELGVVTAAALLDALGGRSGSSSPQPSDPRG